jgi:hypothetical protein
VNLDNASGLKVQLAVRAQFPIFAPESGRPFLAEVPLPEVPGIFLPQNRPYRSV